MQDWNPLRKGDIYCAPACGRDCTWDEFLEAHTEADKLVALLGPSWEKRVWENLGWFYEANLRGVNNCSLSLSRAHGPSMCIFNSAGGSFVSHKEDPRDAIREVFERAAAKHKTFSEELLMLKAGLPTG